MVLDRKKAPQFQSITEIVKTPLEKTVFSNGVLLYTLASKLTSVVRLELVFKNNFSVEQKKGAVSFASKLWIEGTIKHSFREINDYFELWGASLETSYSVEHTTIIISALEKNFISLLPWIQEIVEEASFPLNEIKENQRKAVQNLKVSLEKTNYVADKTLFSKLLGKKHAYTAYLSEADILSIEQEDIKNYYATVLKNQAPILFLTGFISENLIKKIEDLWGKTNKIVLKKPNLEQKFDTNFSHSGFKEEKTQASIRLGLVTITRTHPDFFKFRVLNSVLGGYFGSRLMKNIREEKGLTYGISSVILPFFDKGMWYVSSEVNKELVQKANVEIRNEIMRLQEKEVGKQELEVVKNYLSGRISRLFSTIFDSTDTQKTIILENLSENYYENYLSAVQNVTAKELKEMANLYLKLDLLEEIIVL